MFRQFADLLYRLFNSIFYFTPLLLANYRWRHKFLIPFYKGKAGGGRSDKHVRAVVFMALNETTFSGGLSDRLRGIVSVYAECKRQGRPFRIVFEPLHLEDYLAPNEYDWRIGEDEFDWDLTESYPCVLLTYHNDSHNRWQHFVQSTVLRSYFRKHCLQLHVFTNMIPSDEEYRTLFHELFKPADDLQQLIGYHLEKLGGKGNYISCTFRFRQLLGDFKEGGATLPASKREPYIQQCVQTVEHLHELHPEKKILVTADSHTFLDELMAASLPYVYVMPGKVVHLGFTPDASKAVYMKSFLDMYMISYADTVYLVRDKLMYHSGFPYRAALLGGINYEEVSLLNNIKL